MSKLFEKLLINTKSPAVYKEVGKEENKNKYHQINIKDIYGNVYHYRHQLIYAEGANLPKHLWPVDEFGRQYIVDHIIPVSKGGTDAFENLRLIPLADNPKNENSKENYKNANIKRINKLGAYDKTGKLVKTYNSSSETIIDGFNPSSVRKRMSMGKPLKGVTFKRINTDA